MMMEMATSDYLLFLYLELQAGQRYDFYSITFLYYVIRGGGPYLTVQGDCPAVSCYIRDRLALLPYKAFRPCRWFSPEGLVCQPEGCGKEEGGNDDRGENEGEREP